jgi:hypothetical protein
MFQCRRPGCPSDCGTRRTPTCNDRKLLLALLAALTIGLLVSLAMGAMWFRERERSPQRTEVPVAVLHAHAAAEPAASGW